MAGITGEKIWLDGRFVDWSDATVHVLTHTLHYGLGVFEVPYAVDMIDRCEFDTLVHQNMCYFSLTAVLLGVGIAAVVGVVFGLYPARKAANKEPIESLRYE